MSDRLLPQRKCPLRIYSEAYAMSKPLPKNAWDYAVSLEEFGEGLVGGYQQLLDVAEKTMNEMIKVSVMPPFTIPRITEVPRGD